MESGNPVLLCLGLTGALALGHAPVYAVTATFFAESFGARARYSGISLGYQLAGAVSSGPTPFLGAALFAAFGGFVPVVIMMLVGSVIAALCFAAMKETWKSDIGAAASTMTSIRKDNTDAPARAGIPARSWSGRCPAGQALPGLSGNECCRASRCQSFR